MRIWSSVVAEHEPEATGTGHTGADIVHSAFIWYHAGSKTTRLLNRRCDLDHSDRLLCGFDEIAIRGDCLTLVDTRQLGTR